MILLQTISEHLFSLILLIFGGITYITGPNVNGVSPDFFESLLVKQKAYGLILIIMALLLRLISSW